MSMLSVRSVLRLGVGLLAPIAVAAALANSASAAALDPEQIQVQYLPRDGAAIVLWNSVDKATGYNVYQQEVTKAGSPSTESTATAPVKVNTDAPISADIHSRLVENLTNGKPYHFTVTAIVDGAETDPAGPRVAVSGGDDQGALVAVVPQKPVKLAGLDGFYGYNIGTDLPGSYTVDESTSTPTITMKASGWDIQSQADGMYFLAVPVKGDVTVTARMVSGPTETANQSTWNLGGVQIRGTLDAGSVLAMSQVAHAGREQFKYREEYNTSPPEEHVEATDDPARRPLWVRVVRKGNDFSGFLSDDGNTWTKFDDKGVDGIHTIKDMPAEAYVGLALSAHDDGEYSTAVFDNFTITTPPPAQ